MLTVVLITMHHLTRTCARNMRTRKLNIACKCQFGPTHPNADYMHVPESGYENISLFCIYRETLWSSPTLGCAHAESNYRVILLVSPAE